jgi:HK97 family phage major capsid protein
MKFKSFLNIPSVLALALIACAVCAGVKNDGESAGVAMASIGLFGLAPRKMDANPDDLGGGAFQKQVLDGIGAVKKQVATIEQNFATSDKEAKQLAEDFSKHVKQFDGLPSQVADIVRTVEKIQLKVANERRSNFGSNLDIILGDPEMRSTVNGLIRTGIDPGGHKIKINDDQKKAVEDYRRALTSSSGAGSGYVNTQLLPAIYALIAEHGVWRGFDVTPVGANSSKMIVDTSDPVFGWTAENTAPGESSYNGGPVSAAIGKILGWLAIPRELLADSEIDLAAYLLPKFANAIAYRLDWTALSADGTADTTDGGYTGIFFGGTAAVAATGNVSVATHDLEDYLATMLAVNSAVLSRPANWWVHPQNLVRMISVKDGNGRSIFLPSIDAPSMGGLGSILGAPVVLSHAAPSANTTSSKIAAYGDPKGLGINLREDFEFASSEDVKFTEDQVVFKGRARGAVKVKQASAFGVLTNAAS